MSAAWPVTALAVFRPCNAKANLSAAKSNATPARRDLSPAQAVVSAARRIRTVERTDHSVERANHSVEWTILSFASPGPHPERSAHPIEHSVLGAEGTTLAVERAERSV
jgi:hypothetical protein